MENRRLRDLWYIILMLALGMFAAFSIGYNLGFTKAEKHFNNIATETDATPQEPNVLVNEVIKETLTTTEEITTTEAETTTEEITTTEVITTTTEAYVEVTTTEEIITTTEEVTTEAATEIEEEITTEIIEVYYSASDFMYRGVIWFNGFKWTYYSEKVLPGGGLQIPGRHLDENGYVCDENDYICLASCDFAKGTVIETPLGKLGKIYDYCPSSGVMDVYVGW